MLTHRYDYKRSIRVALAEQRAIATRWALEAKRHGVKAAVFIDAHPVKSVADSILRYQRRRGGIIALSSRGNNSPPLLIGGTTRAVAQGSTSAVWVLYPPAKPGSAIHRPTTDPENTDLATAA